MDIYPTASIASRIYRSIFLALVFLLLVFIGQSSSRSFAATPCDNLATAQAGCVYDSGGNISPGFSNQFLSSSTLNSPIDYTATTIRASSAITSTLAYVTLEYENSLVLVDASQHIPISSIDLSQYGCLWPKEVKRTPDSTQIYVHCWGSSNIIIFDTSQNTYVNTISLPPSTGIGDFTFTRSGDYIVFGSEDTATVYVINSATRNIVKTISSVKVKRLSTHPYLPIIYIGGYQCCDYAYLQILDTNTFTISKSISLSYGIIADVQPSPDGQWFYASNSGYYSGAIYEFDAQTNQIVGDITSLGGLSHIRITPDSSKIFVASTTPEMIYIIDGNTFTYLATVYKDDGTNDMELTCNGNELWVASGIEYMPVINTQDYTIPYKIYFPDTGQSSISLCSTISKGVFTRKAADSPYASPGETVNYTISVFNYGISSDLSSLITDMLPRSLTYVDGSLHATSGSYAYQDGVITWTGSITSSSSVDVNFEALVSHEAGIGSSITNTAVISTAEEIYNQNSVIDIVPYQSYLPCVSAPCRPLYYDDFSDPISGWPVANDDLKSLGYVNGEYQILVKSEGWTVFVHKNLGFNDYKVEVDTRPETHLNGATGLIYSLTDNGFFMLLINDGWFSLWRNDSGNWAQRIGWQLSYAIHPGYQTNHLAIVRNGPNTLLYANGIKFAEDNDSTYLGGGVGMVSTAFSANFDGRFDNFTILPAECNGELPLNVPASEDLSAEIILIGPNANILRR